MKALVLYIVLVNLIPLLLVYIFEGHINIDSVIAVYSLIGAIYLSLILWKHNTKTFSEIE